MRRVVFLLIFVAVISPPVIDSANSHLGVIGQDSSSQDSSSQDSSSQDTAGDAPQEEFLSPDSVPIKQFEQQLEQELGGSFGAGDIAATTTWVHTTGLVDWLGPLAPLALSPFFGVTCLSGLAIWGPEWMTDNSMLHASGPLQNPSLFCLFLALTILTSVPRFTKISKPFAQAVDRVEAYAVIVILLAIKIAASVESAPGDETPVAMVQLGMISFTLDTLLAIAMVINILVINSVKFFFEFMVWLTPVPFLDAVFEVCNKTLCAVLVAIYALSPTLATIINLLMLLVAAIALRWIDRRIRFYRTMVLDPVLARLWRPYGKPRHPELIVFPKTDFGPFAAKSRLRLRRAPEGDGWSLKEANWWMPANKDMLSGDLQLKVRRGWVMQAIEISAPNGSPTILSFSRRYGEEALSELVEQLGLRMSDETCEETPEELAYEFA
jgi:hypothetical protein